MTGRFYLRTIVPIGVLYTGSLVCSNLVYIYLSVAFTQMLKSASPVAVLFTSWAWGVAEPNMSKFINIVVIVIGVGIASFGEIHFKFIGFVYQVGGIVFEAMRIVMIQVMLSGEGVKMDPLVGLYYYAPVCTFFNILVALFTEIPRFNYDDLQRTGFSILLLNAVVAFMLNIASVFLVRTTKRPFTSSITNISQIGKTSGLVLTLTGIFKSILLVVVSVAIWKTEISSLQAFGYFIALLGLAYYSLGYDQVMNLYAMTSAWTSSAFNSYALVDGGSPGGSRTRFLTKRHIFVGAVALFTTAFVVALATMSYNGSLENLTNVPYWSSGGD